MEGHPLFKIFVALVGIAVGIYVIGLIIAGIQQTKLPPPVPALETSA
jgi:hypothetical protein